MAQGAPDDKFVEVEFTASVWTDVTAWVDWSAGVNTQYGRQSPYSQPVTASLSLTLDNTDGRFTPLRQTLKDQTTAHPYYPNVVPLCRIRFGYIMGATRYVRFTGYIKGWPPGFKDVTRERVSITAFDRSLLLSKVVLTPPIRQEVYADGPAAYWPLTDDGSTATAQDLMGGPSLRIGASGSTALEWGVDGPSSANGTAVKLHTTPTIGQFLFSTAFRLKTNTLTIEAWINPGSGAPAGYEGVVGLWDNGSNHVALLINSSKGASAASSVGVGAGQTAVIDGATNVCDGRWHHVLLTLGTTGILEVFTDGVSQGATVGPAVSATWMQVSVGDSINLAGTEMDGSIGQVAIHRTVLSGTRITAHAQAGQSWSGETVDQRIARYLAYAGLSTADMNLDVSTVVLGTSPQDAQDVLTVSQELTDSEGGGSALYIDTDGRARFTNRGHSLPATPVLTLDAAADIQGDDWQAAFDTDTLTNYVTGSRATESGTQSAQIAKNQSSITLYQTANSGDFTSYAKSDADVLANAQERVARNGVPGFRLARVTADLWTGQTAGLYASVAVVRIGDRIRLTNLPAGAGPRSQVDLIVQGFSDTCSDSAYTIAFDTSPADNLTGGIWDDSTFGRWQCDGQALNAALTVSATTVVIKTTPTTKPTFTTDPTAYPLTIQVEQEHIRLNSAPGGASSPQTFTGATRGVDGTAAAAQASSATVTLYPLDTWTL